MKITLKSKEEIGYMREAGRLLAACHQEIAGLIAPGITPSHINDFVEIYLAKNGASPAQKGYRGYPFAICSSVNDTLCHGFPDERPLENGDIVTIDMVVDKEGWLADSAWSYGVGNISPSLQLLLAQTEKALYRGIAKAKVGGAIGDIGHAISQTAKRGGYGIVKPLVGHGIGQVVHEPPDVPSYGRRHVGVRLQEGMVITIEPIFTIGNTGAVLWEDNGWEIVSADGTPGAQFEHTVAITREGPLILTCL